jgi:hypothetical protein
METRRIYMNKKDKSESLNLDDVLNQYDSIYEPLEEEDEGEWEKDWSSTEDEEVVGKQMVELDDDSSSSEDKDQCDKEDEEDEEEAVERAAVTPFSPEGGEERRDGRLEEPPTRVETKEAQGDDERRERRW